MTVCPLKAISILDKLYSAQSTYRLRLEAMHLPLNDHQKRETAMRQLFLYVIEAAGPLIRLNNVREERLLE